MDRISDVEKELKDRLRELSGDDMVASAGEVRQLLDRLDDYRKRIQDRKHKWDAQMAPLKQELHDHRQTIAWARRRLDPEGKGTHFSVFDTYEVAELIKEIEKRRGKIVASRMLYGCRMTESYAEETLGVLTAAIEAAKNEEAKWRGYLVDAREKAKTK